MGKAKPLVLLDTRGNEIDPEQLRLKLAGDVFLSYDIGDIPPQGAIVEICVRGHITPKVELKEMGPEDSRSWAVVATMKAEERVGKLKVLGLQEPQGPLDEAMGAFEEAIGEGRTATLSAGGKKVTVRGRAKKTTA